MARRVGLDRASVVDAAAAIVDAEGLDALTLARLAKQMGVRYQSLYSHVGSPAELQRELQLRYLSGLGEVTRRAAVGKAGRDALVAIADAHLDFDLAHPGLTAVHWKLGVGELTTDAYDDAGDALISVLRSYGMRGEDLVHWRRSLSIMMFGFSSLQTAGLLCAGPDPRVTYQLMIDSMVDVLEARSAEPALRGAQVGAREPSPATLRERNRQTPSRASKRSK